MNLRLEEVRLVLGAFTLELDLTLERAVTGIFGPSGSGKTSLLDLIAGLRKPTAGRLQLDDDLLADAKSRTHLRARRRRIGYVPQDLALFPHLNVRANLGYGYRAPLTDDHAHFSLDHVAEVMEIEPLLERDVLALSGGEQQRVALARAVLSQPRLLLLDEPMSSLDSKLKRRLIPFLHRIRGEFHIPLIYVTHDAAELVALCDEVTVLDHGKLVERCAPEKLLTDV
ncbi:MAG: ATP-binding cassette domain-containing protein [Chthoniobacterales bacterium]